MWCYVTWRYVTPNSRGTHDALGNHQNRCFNVFFGGVSNAHSDYSLCPQRTLFVNMFFGGGSSAHSDHSLSPPGTPQAKAAAMRVTALRETFEETRQLWPPAGGFAHGMWLDTVLYCAMLCYTILYSTILYYTIPRGAHHSCPLLSWMRRRLKGWTERERERELRRRGPLPLTLDSDASFLSGLVLHASKIERIRRESCDVAAHRFSS